MLQRDGSGLQYPYPFIWINIKMAGKRESMLSALYALQSVERKNSRSIQCRDSARWWERKVGWLVHRLYAPKWSSRVREIWRRIFSLDKNQRQNNMLKSADSEKSYSFVKRRERNQKIENPSKISTTQNVFLLQFLNRWRFFDSWCLKVYASSLFLSG